jgi:UDP-N-acetylmuramyl pentapeptide phosphotransferase/UDP-N-acetylglucosamine-1-phosphate transferase
MDDPGHRKIHSSPIPLAGGMAVMTGLMTALLFGAVVALFDSGSTIAGLFEHGLSVRTTQLLGLTT